MSSKIMEDEISSIIKERIDNFEIDIDKEDKIFNDILDSDKKFFICANCANVGDTLYFKQYKEELKSMINNKKLICHSCCTGEYYVQDKPTQDEMLIASFSDFNFISKFDHMVPEIVVEDKDYPHGVKLGTIKSFDDITIKESDKNMQKDLVNYLKKLEKDLKLEKKDSKLDRMLNQPNKTLLIVELADYKRKYKNAKKIKNKSDEIYFKELMEKTKKQIDITHD